MDSTNPHADVAIRRALSPLPEPLKVPLRACYLAYAFLRGTARRRAGKPWRHLLVCGYPRSGTSLLYNMLSAALPGFEFTPFEERALPLLMRPGDIASKTPMDVFEVERMVGSNPFRKSILVIVPLRDLRDVLTSRHPKLPGEYFIGFDHSWWPTRTGWAYDAPGIGAIHEATRELGRLAGVSMLQFRYEELLSAPAEVQARIARALDLDFKVDFAEFHEHQANLPYRYEGRHAAVDQTLVRENMPVDRARAGKWRAPEHRQRIIDQFTRFPALFDLLIDTGYETDTTWFDSYREGNGQHPGSEHQ